MVFEALVIGIAGLAGAVVMAALARRKSRRIVDEARRAAARLVDEAARQASLTRREADAQCREQRDALQRAAGAEQQLIQEESARLQELLQRNEQRLGQAEAQLDKKDELLRARQETIQLRKQEAHDLRRQARDLRRGYRQQVELQAGQTAEELKVGLAERMIEEERSRCADRLRNLETTGAEEFARQAKRVMGIAIQRYSGHCVRDRTTTTVPLDAQAAARLRNEAAAHVTALQEETATRITIADDDSSLRLESGDGVARELCRRVLAAILESSQLREPQRLIAAMRTALEQEIVEGGKEAFRRLRLAVAKEEIVTLVGKLNFRTSYTQNQWRHAVEAGHLASLIAAELGMDPVLARRGALMHDIGKALTHEIDGSHALIGAAIARRNGELEAVANAIGYHHGEEPSGSAYAPLVAAVDAMSGGRPGARREMVESYSDRIGDLEHIASDFEGVTAVHAVQAGRELRVHVDERRVRDDELPGISAAIAQRISDEMTFPGQIRVTVIREFCAVEVAR